jgi:CheY-like chemotaxis protein
MLIGGSGDPVTFTPSIPTPSGDKEKTTILLVEPDVAVRISIAEYLRDCGYHVIETRSAEEAVVVLESGRPVDIVFAEVQLPEMSGFDLAQRVRASYPGTGVLLTYGTEGAAAKAGALCDGGPIAKPYAAADVVRRIKLLRESQRTRKPG